MPVPTAWSAGDRPAGAASAQGHDATMTDRPATGSAASTGSPLRARWAGITAGRLPEAPAARRLLVVSFVDSLGTGMFLTGSALFFTQSVGLTAGQVGLGLSVAAIVGFCCSVPVGRASDRVGARPMLTGLQFWRGACFLAYPFAHGFAAFLVVAALAGAGEWAAPPVVQSLVGSLVTDGSKVRTMSALMIVRNVGFTLGAAAAAAAITLGHSPAYRALVFFDAGTFLVSGLILWSLRIPPRQEAPAPDDAASGAATEPASATTSATRSRPRPGPRYLALTFLNGVLYLNAVILTVGLPLWVVTATKAPPALLGSIVVANTLLAVVLQLRLSRGVEGVRSAAARQVRAGICLAVCCLLVAWTAGTGSVATVVLVLLAVAALTAGEVYQAVGGWGLSFELSPEAGRGYFLSVYNLGTTGAMILGPWLLTSVVLPRGRAGWVGLAVALAAAGACVAAVVRGISGVPAARLSAPGLDQLGSREDHHA